MSKNCIAVGDNCCDVYLNLNRYYPTGNAVDFAVNLKRLGGDVSLLTMFANDAFADAVKLLLDRKQIDYSLSKSCSGKSAEALMNLVNGDRVHVRYSPNALAGFQLNDDDIRKVREFDIVYSERYSKIHPIAAKVKHDANIMIHDFTYRLEDEQTELLIPHVDYAFFSYKQDDDRIREFLAKTQPKGPKAVIAMLGPDGSMAYDGKHWHRVMARDADIVNTVGAGDSYIAGFARGLMENESIPECMERGTLIATEIIQAFEPYLEPL